MKKDLLSRVDLFLRVLYNNKMNNRLTYEYTERSVGAYGSKGEIGDSGEDEMELYFNGLGYRTLLALDHQPSQNSEIDLYFWLPSAHPTYYGCEIKTNLKHTQSYIIVEANKIFKSDANIWLHTENNNYDDIVVYDAELMRQHIHTNRPPIQYYNEKKCYKVNREVALSMKSLDNEIINIINRIMKND